MAAIEPRSSRTTDGIDQAEQNLPFSGTTRLTLARKLAAIGAVFLAVALITIGLSMLVTWQLEGGAAAINEAGRMRMRSYQIALQLRDQQMGRHAASAPQPLQQRIQDLDDSLTLLASGDPQRPLTVPGSTDVQQHLHRVQSDWRALRAEIIRQSQLTPQQSAEATPLPVDTFVHQVDNLVSAIEHRLEARTVALHTFQLVMMGLAVLSALVILYASHVVFLDPIARLRTALLRVEKGDFSARVRPGANDELGELAEGFNRMTEQLATSYGGLEAKVAEKTRRLQAEQARLQALYDVSTFVASADSLGSLGQGFARKIRGIARADAVAIRWSDEANDRYMLLASDSLPHIMAEKEQCVLTGDCFCGERIQQSGAMPRMRVIPIAEERGNGDEPTRTARRHCEAEGYTTLVTLPLNLQHRLLGEIELFYRGDVTFTDEDRSLFEALASHLAGAMETLRMAALERESAVASERKLLAQELHDSIAQSLAFLKIQMSLLRSAMTRGDQAAIDAAMAELDVGVRESYSDVRELLLHFRVRTNSGQLDMALRETLSKFELQSGMATHLHYPGDGVPLPADVQIQVLHIVQEALSNVRKHAKASEVWVDVQAQPCWQISVRDNGQGFLSAPSPDATHVGLSIMRERAARIHADLTVRAAADRGTEVVLTLAAPHEPAGTPQEG